MTKKQLFGIRNIDMLLMLFIFALLFILPVLFTRINNTISWQYVFKIWLDRAPLIPLFIINHWILVPRLILKKRYKTYISVIALFIISITVGYYLSDDTSKKIVSSDRPLKRELPIKDDNRKQQRPTPRKEPKRDKPLNDDKPGKQRPIPKQRPKRDFPADDNKKSRSDEQRPSPVPPYADLLMFSLLIVAVDTGLSFTKHWHRNEEDKIALEKANTQAQLAMLRNQISPHFFMNTLNNIYALVDLDTPKAKHAVMKLSKLMRYMLYENLNGKVLLSKEFEFITSFVELMKLRFTDEMSVVLKIPEQYDNIEIPVLLFISYIENAFKYSSSYQQDSFVNIVFDINQNDLLFTCVNSISKSNENIFRGGIGLQNNQQRLKLLYKKNYSLSIDSTDKLFDLKLKIPLT